MPGYAVDGRRPHRGYSSLSGDCCDEAYPTVRGEACVQDISISPTTPQIGAKVRLKARAICCRVIPMPSEAINFYVNGILFETVYSPLIPFGLHDVWSTKTYEIKSAGSYEFAAKHDKEDDSARKSVSVQIAAPPGPGQGTIQVTSEPGGLRCYIDGRYRGFTPQTRNVTGGIYHIVEVKPGGFLETCEGGCKKNILVATGGTAPASFIITQGLNVGLIALAAGGIAAAAIGTKLVMSKIK